MNNIFSTPASGCFFILIVVFSIVSFGNRRLLHKLMFNPYDVVHRKQYQLFFTSGFVHSDFPHLIFNMLTFYFFAFNLERSIGSINFIVLYLSSLFFSHIPTLVQQKNNPNYYSLGASGAISGILFSSILIYPTSKIMMLPIPIPIPAAIFGVIYLAWCKFAAKRNSDNINHSAHFAGAVTGVIVSFILFGDSIFFIWNNSFL